MTEPGGRAHTLELYAQFQASSTALAARLEAAKQDAHPDIGDLSVQAAKLRKLLVDATNILPSYDQRQCEAQMTTLEGLLEDIRASSVSKPKFSFKRKAPKVPSVALDTVEPASVEPLPLRDPHASAVVDTSPSAFLSLRDQSNQLVTLRALPLASESTVLSNPDLTISNLDHCIVDLCTPVEGNSLASPFSTLHIRDIQDSVLILPIISGSVMLHNLNRCVLAVGCHQFRMHHSTVVDVYLKIPSKPIIEHCSQIRFAPYPPSLLQYSQGSASGLSQDNQQLDVQDFSHIRPTQSPNWSLIEPHALLQDWAGLTAIQPSSLDSILPPPPSAANM